MAITIIPVNSTDAVAIDEAFEVVAASVADLPDFAPPCRRRFLGSFAHPMPGYDFEMYLARLDGRPAGCLRLGLPTLDNTENVSVDLDVHPDLRRRGVGRALHEHLLTRTREIGRKRISSMGLGAVTGSTEESPATPFATGLGASSALLDVRRRIDLTTLDEPELDRLLTAAYARADGYQLVRWSGRTPDEYVDHIAYLEGRLISDAPMGDLAWEPEQMDATRIRGMEAAHEARGRRSYHSAMRDDATGRIVAWTMIDLSGDIPWHAFQQITIVDPDHRGHRLGPVV